MIKINGKEYHDYITDVSWGNFEVYSNGKKRTGRAPLITFNISCHSILIGLELTFSIDMFQSAQLGLPININNFFSDILYEDEKGWTSLIICKYDCNLTRKSETEFLINFSLEDEENKILIDSVVKFSCYFGQET